MSLKIDRFESIEVKKHEAVFTSKTKTGIIIKDHKIDELVCYINLVRNQKDNKELATKIIEVIEEFIVEKEVENAED